MNKIETSASSLAKELTKISFEDDYRQQCSLQKSNALMENKIWLGVDKDINGKAVIARMHLTQNQVMFLLPYLQKFADTGDLY